MAEIRRELLVCRCNNVEHQIVLTWFPEEEGSTRYVFFSIHLKPEKNLWKRFKNAVKYLFGHRSKYGEFDEVVLDEKNVPQMEEVLDFLKGGNDEEVQDNQ